MSADDELPTTAAGWASLSVRAGERAEAEKWKDGKLVPVERHIVLCDKLVNSTIEVLLWEALRLADPKAADLLAVVVAELCEGGDEFAELLYEWRKRLTAELPLSGNTIEFPSGTTYHDIWHHVGLTV